MFVPARLCNVYFKAEANPSPSRVELLSLLTNIKLDKKGLLDKKKCSSLFGAKVSFEEQRLYIASLCQVLKKTLR